VTNIETAMFISAGASTVAALVGIGGLFVAVRSHHQTLANGHRLVETEKKVDLVHKTTNGLSERAEYLARQLGVREGIDLEKERKL
jgi:hypothetical protein